MLNHRSAQVRRVLVATSVGAVLLGSLTPTSSATGPAPVALPDEKARPVAAAQSEARHGHRWVGSWATAVMPPGATPTSTAGFGNQTVRQKVRLSLGGSRVRLEIANTFGEGPLRIADVDVARSGKAGSIRSGTSRQVTFSGSKVVVVPKGARILSDPVRLSAGERAELTVSVYFQAATGPTTYHRQSRELTYVSSPGNHNADVDAAQFPTQVESWFYLSGVQVAGPRRASTVVALGDSITDGDFSTVGADRRWTNVLASRLLDDPATDDTSVLNAGIGANRLLNDSQLGGQNALARFDGDVLAQPRVKTLVLLEGVNDLGFSQFPDFPAANPRTNVSAAEIIAAYEQIIDRAHSRGIDVVGGTVLPFEGAFYWDAAAEAKRQQVNRWIRTSGAFDGVVDFDRVLRDPAKPSALAARYDSGDHLHPNDLGYAAMGNAVRLRCVSGALSPADGRSARCTR